MLFKVLLGVLAFVGLNMLMIYIGAGFKRHPKVDHAIAEIPGVAHENEVSLAADADEHGNVHLLWSTGDEPMHYARLSADEGRWTEPVSLDAWGHVFYLAAEAGRLVAVSSRSRLGDSAIVYRVSKDDGLTWGRSNRLIKGVQVHSSGIARSGRILFAAFQAGDEIAFRRSDDLGATWREGAAIPTFGRLGPRPLSVAVSGGRTFVFWTAKPLGGKTPKPFLAESEDGGDTWIIESDLVGKLSRAGWRDHQIEQGFVAATETDVHLVVSGTISWYSIPVPGVFSTVRPLEGQAWSDIKRWGPGLRIYLGQFDVVASGGVVYAASVDDRYQEYDWTGYIPLPPFVGSGAWPNTDLILSTKRPGRKWSDEVITPRLSFVGMNGIDQTKKMVIADGKLLIFWTGRKKVGKSKDTFGYKNQIFYHVRDL